MKNSTLILFLLSLLATTSAGLVFGSTNEALLTNVSNRKTVGLGGSWNYIIDPYEMGYYNFRMEPYDLQKGFSSSAYYNNYHARNKQELVEYDFDKSPSMEIPSDWNSKSEALLYYEGTVWFKRSFDYDLTESNRLFVHFGAVNYEAEVYLNGKKLGVHEGGFTPFNFEVTGIVKPKDNYLVVKVDNKRRKDGVPTLNTDWWNYGGITRDVLLIEEKRNFVRDFSVRLEGGSIASTATLASSEQGAAVKFRIPELGVATDAKTNAAGIANFGAIDAKPELWSPDSPKLYEVEFEFDGTILRDRIGFRTIETNGPKLLLNGKEIFLMGISIHEENATGGRAHSREDALRLLNWAKEMGCNYVRLAHYPHNEHMVRVADELGLLVWEEIPVYWTIDFTDQKVLEKSRNQLREAITRDRNRASVVIWSVANETPQSDARFKFLSNLVAYARELDGSRLVSAALLHKSEGLTSIVDDPLGKVLDIVAFNQYLGWYGGNLADAEKITWKTPYDKPVFVSEFGGGAKAGLHGAQNERWTEEYQDYLYQQNLKMIGKIPNLSGISPWILVDFRSPRRALPEIQDGYNRKGLISESGVKKRAFYTMKEFYANRNKEYTLVWSDEFNYKGKPDPKKWNHETGYIRNREKQYYTDSTKNVRVEAGNLLIEARREKVKNKDFESETVKDWRKNREYSEYTSGSINTRGLAEWQYGKIEIRAKIPKGKGAWPALWMLGANRPEVGWPKCGEIDIMENVGYDPLTIHGTIHTGAYNHIKGTQRGKTIVVEDPASVYHVYSVEWTPEKIEFLVDGIVYNTFENEHKTTEEWPFDQKFNLKINNAIGGDWGGKHGIDDSSFPQKFYVDWVRVYQMTEKK
ncbi:MAG: family 16 glycosylhydrolase [Pyrinomonadaceae bacterium]